MAAYGSASARGEGADDASWLLSRFAAGGADFPGHRLGGTRVALVAALQAAAKVVDDHLGALLGRDQRAIASDAVTASGDQNNFSLKCAH